LDRWCRCFGSPKEYIVGAGGPLLSSHPIDDVLDRRRIPSAAPCGLDKDVLRQIVKPEKKKEPKDDQKK